MVWKSLFLLAALSSYVRVTSALDVEISDVVCEENRPVHLTDLEITCNGSSRCSFGTNAEIKGHIYYSGVENSGVLNNHAYITADLSFMAMSYNLFEMLYVPMCPNDYNQYQAQSAYNQYNAYNNAQNQYQQNQYQQNQYDNQNAVCPSDGAYSFTVDYELPSAGNEAASWMATGFSGTGTLEMYAQESENMLIGRCTLSMQTFVTQTENSEAGFFASTPSAAATLGIVLGILAVSLLICAYCSCCRGSSSEERRKKYGDNDDATTYFRRMEDPKSKGSEAEAEDATPHHSKWAMA